MERRHCRAVPLWKDCEAANPSIKDLIEVMELLKLPGVCAGSELLALPRDRLSPL